MPHRSKWSRARRNLQLLDIPFVGPDVLSSAACMDKDVTKRLLRDAGISVAPFVVLHRGETVDFVSVSAWIALIDSAVF